MDLPLSGSASGRRSLSRRSLLLGVGAAGLLGGSALAGKRVAAVRAGGAAVSIALEPSAPFAFLSTDAVAQAGAFSLHVHSYYADSGSATFNGQPVPLLVDGTYLVALFGAGQPVDAPVELAPGAYSVRVDISSAGAGPYTFELPISVTAWPFTADYVTLPPGLCSLNLLVQTKRA